MNCARGACLKGSVLKISRRLKSQWRISTVSAPKTMARCVCACRALSPLPDRLTACRPIFLGCITKLLLSSSNKLSVQIDVSNFVVKLNIFVTVLFRDGFSLNLKTISINVIKLIPDFCLSMIEINWMLLRDLLRPTGYIPLSSTLNSRTCS